MNIRIAVATLVALVTLVAITSATVSAQTMTPLELIDAAAKCDAITDQDTKKFCLDVLKDAKKKAQNLSVISSTTEKDENGNTTVKTYAASPSGSKHTLDLADKQLDASVDIARSQQPRLVLLNNDNGDGGSWGSWGRRQPNVLVVK